MSMYNQIAGETAPQGIVKTVFTFTVLHRADNHIGSIEEAMYEANEGDAVGWETDSSTVPVSPDRVADELVALGNDGTFFNNGEEVN